MKVQTIFNTLCKRWKIVCFFYSKSNIYWIPRKYSIMFINLFCQAWNRIKVICLGWKCIRLLQIQSHFITFTSFGRWLAQPFYISKRFHYSNMYVIQIQRKHMQLTNERSLMILTSDGVKNELFLQVSKRPWSIGWEITVLLLQVIVLLLQSFERTVLQ